MDKDKVKKMYEKDKALIKVSVDTILECLDKHNIDYSFFDFDLKKAIKSVIEFNLFMARLNLATILEDSMEEKND